MAKFFGFNPPFISGGILQRQEDVRLIQNDILQLLLTVPGQRVMRPSFGTVIKTQLFDPHDEFAVDDLKRSIALAVSAHEPRVSVNDVSVIDESDNNRIQIIIECSLADDENTKFSIETFIGTESD
jgi:phage baseplate assembly protein W